MLRRFLASHSLSVQMSKKSIAIVKTTLWSTLSVSRRGLLLLALAVLLLGFIIAFVVYDLRNRNKELHHYIQHRKFVPVYG